MKINFLEPSPPVKPSEVEMNFVKIPAGGGCDEFWMSETPVTEAQWVHIMGGTAEVANRPKLNVSFEDAKKFCERLGDSYRIPTEFEYCWALGKEPVNLADYAVFGRKGDCPNVKTKLPNEYGLYDMRGLCWEWLDADSKDLKPLRGGSWNSNQLLARAVYRYFSRPAERNFVIGFRVVLCRPPSGGTK
jgi:formylglycine-generating enzyme required for sulfatase activity